MSVADAARSLRRHHTSIESWWNHNPDFDVMLFDDSDTTEFVSRFASDSEWLAYSRCLVGAQRADLFRVYFIRTLGGFYVDVDLELRAPLRSIIPHNASVVTSERWEIEFMAYEPAHPVLAHVADVVTANVNRAAELWRTGHPDRCTGPHSCIIWTTGPHAHRAAVIDFTKRAGCTNVRCARASCGGVAAHVHVMNQHQCWLPDDAPVPPTATGGCRPSPACNRPPGSARGPTTIT